MSASGRSMVLLALLLGALGCPKELPQDLPPEELYRIGRENFDRGRWNRAIEAFQRFIFQDPGNVKADSALYLTAESYFNQKQYLTAASEFLRLAQNRPAGPLADDSRYRACESYVKLSPRPELDQEYTDEAIDQCRSVVLLYPGSPFAEQAAERSRELTDKLARKTFLNARYYYKRKAYDSAIVYLEHLLKTYRGASVEPEALLMLYETYMKLGYVQEADETRARLLGEYGETPQAKELEKVSRPAASDAGSQ
ncbi:MAG: outer membrane protein assembly factor BamD [Gemmatimonadota bacterium]|nr:MAG: outer membrane protein assembly factor BamD [Gemmatimonadota bacterium]